MNDRAQNSSRNTMLGRILGRGIPLVVLLGVAVGAYLYWQRADHTPEPASAQPAPGPVPVHVATVQQETVPMELRFLGQTEASSRVEIRARIAGHLVERSFVEGQLVEKGEKLFQVDPRPFQVQLAQARAQLASAEASKLRAEQQLARYARLSPNAISSQDIEEAQATQRMAAAEVAVQKAQIDAVNLQLQYTSVESPITGLAGIAIKDVGDYIDAGANSHLTTVHKVDPMYIRYFVTEQDILHFRNGVAEGRIRAPKSEDVEIEVTLSDGSVHPHPGRINFLDVQIDPETGTSIIRGVVPNPDGDLIPGQFIYAKVLGVQRVGVLRVPQEAVRQSPAGASVYVVNDEDRVESRPVTLGPWSGEDQWIIETGLEPGESVIVDRLMQVRPGMPVTIATRDPPSPPTPPTALTESPPRAGQAPATRERTPSP